jgi:LmbE family N-acetylglucosaminyl deacetylase
VSTTFDHRVSGTSETRWRQAGLADLNALDLPARAAQLVVLAAHPDDETLGAGGLIAAAADRGIPVTVVVATNGEASHPQSPTWSPERLAAVRKQEVQAALAVLDPAARVVFLGLPDGRLHQQRAVLVKRLRALLPAGALIASPWRGDGHPDHEACAHAADALAQESEPFTHWEYPIWAWHWADPNDLPWAALRRLPLDPANGAAKQAALTCHRSQHSPLSAAAGDEAILAPEMLEHFTRDFEVFVVASSADGVTREHFDALYAGAADPWQLETRFYEQRKRSLLLASLPRPRFRRAFEPGCATGLLTEELAARCDEVLAWDVAGAAVGQTRERVSREGVEVERRAIPLDWPYGSFDLIVLSEVGYYHPDLQLLRGRIEQSLATDGVLVACHWRHPAHHHSATADAVHDALGDGLSCIARHREEDFLLDVWGRDGTSVAAAEGIVDVAR